MNMCECDKVELKLQWLFPHSRSPSGAPNGAPSGAPSGAFSFCGAGLSVFVMGLGLEFVFVVLVTQINAVMKFDL